MRRFALPALLAVALLIAVGCQDHRWAENGTPVCNQTAEPEVQEIAGKLDILFVIDSSGTMQEEQLNISTNFDAFIVELVGEEGAGTDVDYQIGVVTTDVQASGCRLRSADGNPDHRIIKGQDPTGYWTDQRIREVFAANIQAGTTGTSFEQGLEAMRCALAHPENADFLRPGSKLAIVFVTDENDCSHPACAVGDTNCIDGEHPLFGCDDRSDELTPVAEYFDWLVDEDGQGPDIGKRYPRKLIVAGIVGVRDQTAQSIPLRHEGSERDYEVACWPFSAEQSGDSGTIAVDPTSGAVTLSVPAAQHSFNAAADVGRFVQIPYSATSAARGSWEIIEVLAAGNSVRLRTQAVIENQGDASWALGVSDGLATEGSRYIDLITRACKAAGTCMRDDQIPLFASTICTRNWSETMSTIGAIVRLSSDFCLDALPAGVEDTTCPAIESWVSVELHDEAAGQFLPFSCNDAQHGWSLQGADTCGSGWAIHFEGSTPDAPFPEPGRGIRIQYLAEQGNSPRCVMTQTVE